jgi:hypothetical protein
MERDMGVNMQVGASRAGSSRRAIGVVALLFIVAFAAAPSKAALPLGLGQKKYCIASPMPKSDGFCHYTSTSTVVRWAVPSPAVFLDWFVIVDGTVVACHNFYQCPHWHPTGSLRLPPGTHTVELEVGEIVGNCGLCLWVPWIGEIQDYGATPTGT